MRFGHFARFWMHKASARDLQLCDAWGWHQHSQLADPQIELWLASEDDCCHIAPKKFQATDQSLDTEQAPSHVFGQAAGFSYCLMGATQSQVCDLCCQACLLTAGQATLVGIQFLVFEKLWGFLDDATDYCVAS